jgi:hypothetical protein
MGLRNYSRGLFITDGFRLPPSPLQTVCTSWLQPHGLAKACYAMLPTEEKGENQTGGSDSLTICMEGGSVFSDTAIPWPSKTSLIYRVGNARRFIIGNKYRITLYILLVNACAPIIYDLTFNVIVNN